MGLRLFFWEVSVLGCIECKELLFPETKMSFCSGFHGFWEARAAVQVLEVVVVLDVVSESGCECQLARACAVGSALCSLSPADKAGGFEDRSLSGDSPLSHPLHSSSGSALMCPMGIGQQQHHLLTPCFRSWDGSCSPAFVLHGMSWSEGKPGKQGVTQLSSRGSSGSSL